MTLAHIHAPTPTDRRLIRLHCPTCGVRRYMTCYSYEWYGPSITCLKCGEHWQDGEMMQRPFMRGWRKKAVAEAKRYWRRLRELHQVDQLMKETEDDGKP